MDGVFREMSNRIFDELIDGSCPRCDTMLAIRSLPTLDEIRAAAAIGIPEAVAELRSIEEHSAGRGTIALMLRSHSRSSPTPELSQADEMLDARELIRRVIMNSRGGPDRHTTAC